MHAVCHGPAAAGSPYAPPAGLFSRYQFCSLSAPVRFQSDGSSLLCGTRGFSFMPTEERGTLKRCL
ncbi:hypothetical protein NFI96_033167, partial [Prochilodus magdalenae]